MRHTPFNFEIEELLTQFAAAFNGIKIKRFAPDKTVTQTISVPFVYMPKKRVVHDVLNKEKSIQLPVVSFSMAGFKYNIDRERNKQEPFYVATAAGASRELIHPVPIDLTINLSVMAKYTTDIDQILQNFATAVNPYVILQWRIPKGNSNDADYLVSCPVIWDGMANLEYNVDITEDKKDFVTCDTSFTLQGFLFRTIPDVGGNIRAIRTVFSATQDYKLINDTNYNEIFDITYQEVVSNESVPKIMALSINGIEIAAPIPNTTLPRLPLTRDFNLTFNGQNMDKVTAVYIRVPGISSAAPELGVGVSATPIDFTATSTDLSVVVPRTVEGTPLGTQQFDFMFKHVTGVISTANTGPTPTYFAFGI